MRGGACWFKPQCLLVVVVAGVASQTLEEKVNFFIESCLGNIGDGAQQQQQHRYLKIENTTTTTVVAAAAATTTTATATSSEFCNLFHFQTNLPHPSPNPHAARQLCCLFGLNERIELSTTGRWRCLLPAASCRLTHKPNRSRTETSNATRRCSLPKLCHDVVVNDAIANRRIACGCCCFTISRLSCLSLSASLPLLFASFLYLFHALALACSSCAICLVFL